MLRDDVAQAADAASVAWLATQPSKRIGSMAEAIAAAIIPLMIERCAGVMLENWGITKQRFVCNGTALQDTKGNEWFFAAPEVEAALKAKVAAIRQLGSE